MLREQILGRFRGGMEAAEICRDLGVEPEVVALALEGIGGSTALRKELRAEEERAEEKEDVSKGEAAEMLGIIKGLARESENEFTKLAAAKYVYGVRAGYHRSYADINPNRGHLLVEINQAYSKALLRARQVLEGKTAAAVETVEVDVTPKP